MRTPRSRGWAIVTACDLRVKVDLWSDEAALISQLAEVITANSDTVVTLEACGARARADVEVVRPDGA